MIGWDDIAPARLLPTTIVQHWRPAASHVAAARGVKVIVSPASKRYLDMKYDRTTVLGTQLGGGDRGAHGVRLGSGERLASHPPEAILGVEAPLWTETWRRWRTSSTWRSRGCRLSLKSAGRRRRRESGRTSAGGSPLTGRGGRR